MGKKEMKFNTKLIHSGIEADPATGAIMTPIYQTSTYKQDAPGLHKGYEYSRSSNPTRKTLEANLAVVESGEYGLCFSSGLAAIDALLKTLNPGDEVIATNDLYGGSHRLFTKLFQKFGIKFTFLSMQDLSVVEAAITEKTKMIWLETPTNPMMNVFDISGVAQITNSKGIKLAVDNTFATPYLQRPLEMGADVVMHSLTKYMGGHSDVLMGALICKDKKLADQLYFIQKSSGAVSGPMDCFLVLRGIKTLHLRMERHCENGAKVAHYLRKHPKVANVYWPGFEDHPGHDLAKRQMKDFGGMLSFDLKVDQKENAFHFLSELKIFSLAESLGGVESLACYPASMTHASISIEDRHQLGISDSLIRLSVGVEDSEDLLADLENALKVVD